MNILFYFYFQSLFSLLFDFEKSDSFLSCVQPTYKSFKVILNFCYSFSLVFIPGIPVSFWFFLQIHISLLRLPIWYYTVSTLSIRILSILIIVVLNSLIIPASLLPCLSVSTSLCFLSFDMPCNFLLISGHAIVLIEKWNCCQKALVNALMRCEGRAVLYSPVIRCQSLSKPMPLCCELYSASMFLPTWVGQDG